MNYNEYQRNLKNLMGSFSVEGIDISKSSLENIEKLSNGEESCYEIIEKIKMNYMKAE